MAQEKTGLDQQATPRALAHLTLNTGQELRVVRNDARSESRYFVTIGNQVVGNVFAVSDREAICMGLVRFTELIRDFPN